MDTKQTFVVEVMSDAGLDLTQIRVAVENIGGDVLVEYVSEAHATKAGRLLHDRDFEALADEAERGYEIPRPFQTQSHPPPKD